MDICICFYCDFSRFVIGRRNVIANTGRFLGITVGVYSQMTAARINIENTRGILAPVRAALPGMCPLMSFGFHSYCTDSGLKPWCSITIRMLHLLSGFFYFYGSYETKAAHYSSSRRRHGAISQY